MAFIESRRPLEDEPYPPPGRTPERDEDRLRLYYRWRSPGEEDRLPDKPFDRYPDGGGEGERDE